MKLNISAEINGHEIIESFIKNLKDNNLSPDVGQIKVFVLNKAGQEVEVTPDKIVVKYNENK